MDLDQTSMANKSVLEIAVLVTSLGLSVIPIKPDGSKQPSVEWADFQHRIASPATIRSWFRPELNRGIAIVGGEVSGNLEILDFDDPDKFEPWIELIYERGLGDLFNSFTILQTPRGGYHVIYRCTGSVDGNQKLALRTYMKPDGTPGRKTLIETRAEGGYCLTVGSPPECHPSGRVYEFLQGDFTTIPTISQAQRHALLAAAKSLTEVQEETTPPCSVRRTDTSVLEDRPGDDFNRRATWEEVLSPHGWTKVKERGGEAYWVRPGGTPKGHDATTNYNGSDVLYVFSTNAYPLEDSKPYTKFAAYAVLNHGGNFSAAAAELKQKGYGDSQPIREPSRKEGERSAPTETENGQIEDKQPQENDPAPEAPVVAKKARRSQRDILIEITAAHKLWHDAEGNGYVSVGVSGHIENFRIRSAGFKHWLCYEYYLDYQASPSGEALADAMRTIEAAAVYDGPLYDPAVRVAALDGHIYFDLCNEEWQSIEIAPSGWQLTNTVPVKFVRKRGMRSQCTPQPGTADDLNALRELLSLRDQDAWTLFLATAIAALRPIGPFPVLVTVAEQGSGKSTLARVLRALIDPSIAPLRSTPRDERDLFIAAKNGWMIVLDNLSRISPELSDQICRLSTGGGNSFRELYSDDEETLFFAQRPVVINGIDELATRGDLMDRAVVLNLPPIPEHKRMPEVEFWARFDSIKPRVLGALCSAVSIALRNLPTIKLDRLPRMAEFALWATAAEPGLGLQPGAFMSAYTDNQRGSTEMGLEASPLANLIQCLELPFTGTTADLLSALKEKSGDNSRLVPTQPHFLSNKLRRIAPILRQVGINVRWGEGRQRRTICIERVNAHSVEPHQLPLFGAESWRQSAESDDDSDDYDYSELKED